MMEFLGINTAVNLVYALGALFVMFWGLRWLDARSGRPWKETAEKIKEESLASAIYYGARWMGASIVVAAFIGG